MYNNKRVKKIKDNLCVQICTHSKDARIYLRFNSGKKELIKKVMHERNIKTIQEFFDRVTDFYLIKAGYLKGEIPKRIIKAWDGDVEDMPLNY